MTWLLIDAMNVIGSRPDGWWHDREAAVAAFLEELRAAAPRLEADRLTVVVDGHGTDVAPSDAGVEVVWAGGGSDAADVT